MSLSAKALISDWLRPWLLRAVDYEPSATVWPGNFWVNPAEANDPSLGALIKRELHGLKGFVLRDSFTLCGRTFVEVSWSNEAYVVELDPPQTGAGRGIELVPQFDFLRSCAVIKASGIACKRNLHSRVFHDWDHSGCLVDDVLPYLPEMAVYRYDQSDLQGLPARAVVLAILIDQVGPESHLYSVKSLLEELLILVASTGHRWLLSDLGEVIHSSSSSFAYLSAYRLIEFFHPLAGMLKLKKTLSEQLVGVSELDLFYACRASLGFFVSHTNGATSSAEFATDGFARSLGLDPSKEGAKEAAARRLVEIRNQCAHQGFGTGSFNDDDVKVALKASLEFLVDAFRQYATKSSVAA